MQILSRDDNRLVIHQGPWPLRLMGLVFAGAGCGILAFIVSGHLREHNAWVAVVVGAVFALVGFAMMLGARDVLVTFDKGARSVTMRRRGVFASRAEIYAWGDIADVALERRAVSSRRSGGTGGPTYRPVLVMTSGARVPWTGVLTSDERSQAVCVAAARTFGGWHQLTGDAAPAHDAAVRRAASNARAVRVFAMPVLAMFVAVGLFMTWLQWRRYELWRPTRAVVTSTDLAVVHGQKGDTWRPVIAYRYVDAMGIHDAAGATILTVSSSRTWASGIVNRYHVGDSVTAYIDPDHADRGFVERRMSWLPFVFVVLPLVLGVFIFRVAGTRVRGAQLAGVADVPILPQ